MYKAQYEILESQLEPGYSHLNHAASLTLLERGRLDYLDAIGIPNESLHLRKLFLVIAGIEVRYLREIFAGPIEVTIDTVSFVEKKMLLTQRAINQRGKVCVEATYDFRMLDGNSKRSVLFPEDFSRLMSSGVDTTVSESAKI